MRDLFIKEDIQLFYHLCFIKGWRFYHSGGTGSETTIGFNDDTWQKTMDQ
jgi:hypothetical protein